MLRENKRKKSGTDMHTEGSSRGQMCVQVSKLVFKGRNENGWGSVGKILKCGRFNDNTLGVLRRHGTLG